MGIVSHKLLLNSIHDGEVVIFKDVAQHYLMLCACQNIQYILLANPRNAPERDWRLDLFVVSLCEYGLCFRMQHVLLRLTHINLLCQP